MSDICLNPNCGLQHGITCEEGHIRPKDCPHYRISNSDEIDPECESFENLTNQRLPWTGRALGVSDLMLPSSSASTSLVGLVGPYNAGKTAFLVSLFAQFEITATLDQYSFAGSYTLQAWDRLKKYMEWPNNAGPSFPPHTPDSGERVPSLLNLALRKGNEPIKQLLFTDAPGEWFSRWTNNQSADDAQGARWIAKHATHFLFFIDREALNGGNVGKVRQQTLQLARLLAELKGDRPLFVIWSKSDLEPNHDVEEFISKRILHLFGPHMSFESRIDSTVSLDVLRAILDTTYSPIKLVDLKPSRSPFAAFRPINS